LNVIQRLLDDVLFFVGCRGSGLSLPEAANAANKVSLEFNIELQKNTFSLSLIGRGQAVAPTLIFLTKLCYLNGNLRA
jgi:hypothetical protein